MVNNGIAIVPIESNAKKSTFISEVARSLGFENVHPFRGRMEDFPLSEAGFDWITARAVGTHQELVDWAAQALAPMGQLVLWLGEADASCVAEMPDWSWRSPIKIPDSDRRVILVGKRHE